MSRHDGWPVDLHFGEAPRWHDGELWFSDFYDYAVKTVDLDGQVRVKVSIPTDPAGLAGCPMVAS